MCAFSSLPAVFSAIPLWTSASRSWGFARSLSSRSCSRRSRIPLSPYAISRFRRATPIRSSSASARENATIASSVSPFRKYRTPRLLYAPASDGSIRRAKDRRMSTSPPFAAAGGRAVAAGVIWSVYANRAEDCVEGALIGDEQEESVQALNRLLPEELCLPAKDRRL